MVGLGSSLYKPSISKGYVREYRQASWFGQAGPTGFKSEAPSLRRARIFMVGRGFSLYKPSISKGDVRERFIEIRSTQPMGLVADSWTSVAASAGERAVRRSLAGHSPSCAVLRLRSVCRTTLLGMLFAWGEKSDGDSVRLPAG